MRAWLGHVAAVVLLVAYSGRLEASSYDATHQFSASNPTQVWAYGYGVTGSSFTLFPVFTGDANGVPGLAFWNINGNPIANIPFAGANQTGATYVYGGTLVFPTQFVIMHPGLTTDAIVQWTAPASGTYSFSGTYAVLDEITNGFAALIFDNATKITTMAFNGGRGVLGGRGSNPKKGLPGSKERFAFQLTVSQGDVISFGLNGGGVIVNDTAGFAVRITSTSP